ncbi:hypothetical protein J5N97_017879 [Dioscorea zingiberensis]|uniref:VQ domain-containing protein n=1 Tax=Dioscorea zingiberensis TaxID=325984 RepID=A0A9D5CMU7_9LILI|nr:hypothetical protein J5N97_017879 [Dioscorea zingiberensis]
MSDTTSTTPDWAQLYHRNFPGGDHPIPPTMFGSSVADSTVVTTTASHTLISPPPTGATHSNIEGRVGKSTRRRSRASRKAPTTLLNTDTTNFRAMVQQFTGIPSGPYSSGIQTTSASPFINFGVLSSDDNINFNAHIQPQYNNNNNNNPTMFMLNNNNNNNNNNNSDGFFLDGLPAGHTATPRPASSNGYLF